jgi:poly(A) polymerase
MSDPAREFATEVIARLRGAGEAAYLAGGCVRDLLLGRPAKDFDVATSATPERVRTLFGPRRTIAVGASFGVMVVLGSRKEQGQVEVATFRQDGDYLDGRRPSSVVFCDAEEDARRRDFTMNGLFYDPVEQRVLDFVGGEHDLAQRVVRAIGTPRDRLVEDKLRMLRAVRFTATLDFSLEAATADAVRDLASQINVVSAERIAQEVHKMLVHPQRVRAVTLLAELGLLPHVLPEITVAALGEVRWQRLLRRLSHLVEPTFPIAWAAALADTGPETVHEVSRRLKLSNDDREQAAWLVAHMGEVTELPEGPLAAIKKRALHPWFAAWKELCRAALLADEADLHPVLWWDEFLLKTPQEELNPPMLLTGDDLRARGFKPGPVFKTLLDGVRDGQLNGEITDVAAAWSWIDQHLGP